MRLREALVLALLLAPVGAAGSERDPDVVSPRDRPNPSGDLLAAWIEHDERGMLVTFKTARLAEREESLVYTMVFELDGQRHAPAVGWDSNGRLQADTGANHDGWGRGRLDNKIAAERAQRGSPGYLAMIIPWGVYGLQEGDTIRPIRAASALCCDRSAGGGWSTPYDDANAERGTVTLAAHTSTTFGEIFPIIVPAWVIPTLVIGMTLGGAASGALLAQVTRTKAAPAPIPVPVKAEPPRPPGSRFQRAPPGQR